MTNTEEQIQNGIEAGREMAAKRTAADVARLRPKTCEECGYRKALPQANVCLLCADKMERNKKNQ